MSSVNTTRRHTIICIDLFCYEFSVFYWVDTSLYFCFYCYGNHRDLHVLTLSFPTRRSSNLILPYERDIGDTTKIQNDHRLFQWLGQCAMIDRKKRSALPPRRDVGATQITNDSNARHPREGCHIARSKERRVGKECVRTCKSRLSVSH